MKNNLLVLAAIICLAGSALARSSARPAPEAAPARKSKPNLVFIIADQLRYQSCGFAGDSRARTPQLDGLAKQGVVFRNAVSGHPVCAAYRASLFTGKYTTSTGMVINELRMNPNHEFLAQVLTRQGYDTYKCQSSLLTQRQHFLSLRMGLGLLIQQVGDAGPTRENPLAILLVPEECLALVPTIHDVMIPSGY